MKKQLRLIAQLTIAVTAILVYTGCFKDSCTKTYTIYYPVFKSLTEVRANMKGYLPQPVKTTGKIFTLGNYIFLSEPDKGIHVFDNSNPSSPKNISFIAVPGNQDLAVKGNYLYADSYSDLVVFDISNPAQVTAKKFIDNAIPERNIFYYGQSANPDSIQVIVDYKAKDTTTSCETYNIWYGYGCPFCNGTGGFFLAPGALSSNKSNVNGTAGSMSRFALLNDYLYTVSSVNVTSFDVSNPSSPSKKNTVNAGWGIETIYPFENKLFLGSTNGMYIFDVSDPSTPSMAGSLTHVRSCDPIIADGKYAYVTLHDGTKCGGYSNQLDVLDVSNINSPVLVNSFTMTNPHGLAKDGNWLFICDGRDGLRVYDANNPASVVLEKHITGLETYDAIAGNGYVLVVATDGLYQFNYSDIKNIQQVSKIAVGK